MSLEVNPRTLYVLRSELVGNHHLVASRVVCSSLAEVQRQRAMYAAAEIAAPFVCVGPPEPALRALHRGVSATGLLDEVSMEIEALLRGQPPPIVLLETIPSALCQCPAIQDWSGPQAEALAVYEFTESYNEGARAIAAAHNIWLLDCDRAVARSGAQSGTPVDGQSIELEFRGVVNDAFGEDAEPVRQAGRD